MNTPEAKRTVVLATVGVLTITTVSSLSEKHTLPGIKVPLGAFVSGILLSLLAEPLPELAGSIAALALVTSLFVYGAPAWAGLTKLVGYKGSPSPARPPPSSSYASLAPIDPAAIGALEGATGTAVGKLVDRVVNHIDQFSDADLHNAARTLVELLPSASEPDRQRIAVAIQILKAEAVRRQQTQPHTVPTLFGPALDASLISA